MTRLEHLPEECLQMVLKQLPLKEKFKMLRVDKQMNRLVTEEMRNNVKSIAFPFDRSPSLCPKHGSKQLLFFRPPPSHKDACKRASRSPGCFLLHVFLSVLSKCTGVRHVNFGYSELPYYLLFEVFRLCPQLKCFKLNASVISEQEWGWLLNRFGKRIVHFNKSWYDELPESTRLLKIFAANCSNIEEIDWVVKNRLTSDFVDGLKMLPNNCWFWLICDSLPEEGFADVVDKLEIKTLDWSLLGQRTDRLLFIRFLKLNPDDGPVRGVDFAGLKIFDASAGSEHNPQLFNCLVASRFPQLEEFGFRAHFTEDEYSALFQQMPTVKKLKITWSSPAIQSTVLQLPQWAFRELKNLEEIELEFGCVQKNWQPNILLKQLEKYVDEIRFLKKLTVKRTVFGGERAECEWLKKVTDEVNRMKLKQTRVAICFFDKRLIAYKNQVLVVQQNILPK